MKKINKNFKASVLMLAMACLSQMSQAEWTINNKQIIDANGSPFVVRGVTIDGTLAPEKTLNAIKDAATAGANAVQIEFVIEPASVVVQPPLAEFANTCKENKVVCILEPNNLSGYPYGQGARAPYVVIDYWKKHYFLLRDYKDNVIIGLGNHAMGDVGATEFIGTMFSELPVLQSAFPGFLIMIDANDWGQDTSQAMQSFAGYRTPFPQWGGIIYSVDMFSEYMDPQKVHDYIARFSEINAPLIIGGFAPEPYYHPNNVDVEQRSLVLPVESIMQFAEQYHAGYIGWSWSGNKNPALDVVNDYDAGNFTAWGNQLFNGVNGIKATAKIASIYENNSSSSHSSKSANSNSSSSHPPVKSSSSITDKSSSSIYSSSSIRTTSSSSIKSSSSFSATQTRAQCSYQIQSQWNSGFTAVIRIKNITTTVINGWDVNWQYADGSKITNLWNATFTGGNPYSATNLNWNATIQPGQTVEFGFQGSKPASAASTPLVTGAICQ